MCNLFIKHFDFDPPSDVANDLEEANKETLAKSGLSVITICGMDLSSKKKLKKLKELLSRCPEVKKIELVFCSLTNERLLELFEAIMNLKCLLFLGKWLICSEKGTAWPSGCNLEAPSSITPRTASVAEWLERGHEFNPRPNYSPGFVLGSSELNSSFALVNS